MHTHTHTRIRTCKQQRRATLVVDLQDKYYSEKLDYRYRPPPNATAVRRRIVPTYQYTRNVRACVRAYPRESASEKPRGYHPNLPLLQHSISPFSLLRARPRYLTNFQYISTTRNDIAHYGEYRQTIGSRNLRLPITHDDIADRDL